MNHIGILCPNGSFIECESYEHLALAKEIAEKLDPDYAYKGHIACETYLQKLSYIIVRSRDVYGAIGYLDDDGKIIYLSDDQKKWLEDHYDEFPRDKQKFVDDLIDHNR